MSKIYVFWKYDAYKDSDNPEFITNEEGYESIKTQIQFYIDSYCKSIIDTINKFKYKSISGLYEYIFQWLIENQSNKSDDIHKLPIDSGYHGFISLRTCDKKIRNFIIFFLSQSNIYDYDIGFTKALKNSNVVDILLLINRTGIIEPLIVFSPFNSVKDYYGDIHCVVENDGMKNYNKGVIETIEGFVQQLGNSEKISVLSIPDKNSVESCIYNLIESVYKNITIESFYNIDIMDIPASGILSINKSIIDGRMVHFPFTT